MNEAKWNNQNPLLLLLLLFLFSLFDNSLTFLSPPDFTVMVVWSIWLLKLTTYSPTRFLWVGGGIRITTGTGVRQNGHFGHLRLTWFLLFSEFVLNSGKSENFLFFLQ